MGLKGVFAKNERGIGLLRNIIAFDRYTPVTSICYDYKEKIIFKPIPAGAFL